MKKMFLFFALAMVTSAGIAKASSDYYINDNDVESKLSTARQELVDFQQISLADLDGIVSVQEEKNAWVAVILDFFLGGIAVHRVYLGGKPMLMLTYFITCGGIFGIVPLVDLVVLVINNQDITPYVNNDKFIMW